jgi:large subunit ribosomal protein L30
MNAEKKKSGNTITVEQYRSGAGRTKEVKTTLTALGLGRIGKRKEIPLNPAVEGMIKRVAHLVKIVK